jgi:hypothetical protein
MKLHTRENGPKVKSRAKEKLFSKAEAFLKDHSRMILKKDMEKCTTIPQGIISKGNGKMTRNKVKVQ